MAEESEAIELPKVTEQAPTQAEERKLPKVTEKAPTHAEEWKAMDVSKAKLEAAAKAEEERAGGDRAGTYRNLPDEKLDYFANILGKFSGTEAEGHLKELEGMSPNRDLLVEKADDLSLKPKIFGKDHDSDRRYHRSTVGAKEAAANGERFANPSPYKEYFNVEMQTKEDLIFFGELRF